MSIAELSALSLLGLLAWFWFDSLKARETGIAAARNACEREGVQLLDETVAGRSLRLARDEDGRMRYGVRTTSSIPGRASIVTGGLSCCSGAR